MSATSVTSSGAGKGAGYEGTSATPTTSSGASMRMACEPKNAITMNLKGAGTSKGRKVKKAARCDNEV